MKYAILSKIKGLPAKLKELVDRLIEEFRVKVIRPIEKSRRRKEYFHRRELVQETTGELIEKFEPMLMHILNSTLSDYRESVQPQNFYTKQACHDIRRLYEIKLKSFISSKK